MIKVVIAFTLFGLLSAAIITCFVIAPIYAGHAKCHACRTRPCRCGNALHPRY